MRVKLGLFKSEGIMQPRSLPNINVFQTAVLASLCAHVLIFAGAQRFLPQAVPQKEPVSIKVSLAERTPAPRSLTPVPQPTTVPTPRPRVRVDRRLPPPPTPQKPPEVRAGLSDSLAKPGTARDNAPAIAVGNSSLAGVNPDDANKPVAEPLTSAEPEPVAEAAADAPAQCPLPPNLELTTDALNAGLTNAEVVIEVAVASSGSIQEAKIKTGTGFDIDKIAIKAALKLKCSPAIISGRAVPVIGKKLVWKVMYD